MQYEPGRWLAIAIPVNPVWGVLVGYRRLRRRQSVRIFGNRREEDMAWAIFPAD